MARLAQGFVAAAILVVALALGAVAAPTFPQLTGRVVDGANVIPADKKVELEAKLAALEQKTTDQLVVVTLPSLQGYDIADYGYQLGRAWGIGQKGKNNGVILIVAPSEHAVRIEVGYGLEGDLTDAATRIIIENAILPRFRANDYPGGIDSGVNNIVQLLTGDADALKGLAPQRPEQNSFNISPFFIILIIWIMIIIFTRFSRRGGPWIMGGPGWGGGSSGGWSGGGGGGSFGGGGFSGGGGSFGGGGSSGRW